LKLIWPFALPKARLAGTASIFDGFSGAPVGFEV
jgi:hypothetical protein